MTEHITMINKIGIIKKSNEKEHDIFMEFFF
jgi:hypothetical protein